MFSLQMPSAMVGNSAAQSAILDLGSGSQNDTMKQVLGVVDKKVRNMEKKKVFAKKKKRERERSRMLWNTRLRPYDLPLGRK